MLAILFLGFCAVAVLAQDPVKFTASVAPESIAAGGSGTAKITATIESPWKMYSLTQGSGGPIPTKITIDDAYFQAGKIAGPKPKIAFDPNFGINTEAYSGEAAFTVPFTVTSDAPDGRQDLRLSVKYQVCNDTLCLPPKTVKLAAGVTVTGGKAVAASTSAATSPSPAIVNPSPAATPA